MHSLGRESVEIILQETAPNAPGQGRRLCPVQDNAPTPPRTECESWARPFILPSRGRLTIGGVMKNYSDLESQVASCKSQVASRKSQVASRKSQVARVHRGMAEIYPDAPKQQAASMLASGLHKRNRLKPEKYFVETLLHPHQDVDVASISYNGRQQSPRPPGYPKLVINSDNPNALMATLMRSAEVATSRRSKSQITESNDVSPQWAQVASSGRALFRTSGSLSTSLLALVLIFLDIFEEGGAILRRETFLPGKVEDNRVSKSDYAPSDLPGAIIIIYLIIITIISTTMKVDH
ncbi:hypothetical protein B7494_g6746 [Chlorociboria aeruginascens]|nr:hypothetical protein B7494_g6746 [Chlorociboria aeruginascens]